MGTASDQGLEPFTPLEPRQKCPKAFDISETTQPFTHIQEKISIHDYPKLTPAVDKHPWCIFVDVLD